MLNVAKDKCRLDKLKLAVVILAVMVIVSISYGVGRASTVVIADTGGSAYKVYIYENGAATIKVDNAAYITEGTSGLFISRGECE